MSQTKAQLISDLVQALNFTGTSSAPANGMYLSHTNTIKLATNSNPRLTIDSSGNAIFTGNIFTTVLRRDVQDSSVILSGGNATNDGANIALYGSTHGSQAGNFEFRSGASYVLKIKSDGKVGIGTTSPTETLHVYQNAVDNVNVLLEQAYVNSGNLIQFKQTTTGSVTRTAYIGHGGDATGQLMIQNSGNIYLQTGGSNTALTIDASQNVGIGTTSPNNKLDVNGGIVCSPNTDGKDTFELSTHGANEGRLRIKNVDTTTIQIRAGGDTYFNGGNVGIGTTSQDGLLHVHKDTAGSVTASTDGNIAIFEDDASNGISLLIPNSERANIFFGTTGTNGNKEASIQYAHEAVSTVNDRRCLIFKNGGDNERMRIDSSGRVGIKNTSMSSFNTGMDDLVIGNGVNGTSPGMTIFSNSSDIGSISFRDSADTGISGLIQYRHQESPPYMRFMVEGTDTAKFTTHGGIAFKSDTAAANTLDDYEEGTWTGGIQDFSATYTSQNGYYTKVGNLVTATVMMAGSGSPGSGNMKLTSLPFTCQNGTNYRAVASFFCWTGFVTGGLQIVGSMSNNTNYVNILGNNNNGNATHINRSALNSGGWEFQLTISYHV